VPVVVGPSLLIVFKGLPEGSYPFCVVRFPLLVVALFLYLRILVLPGALADLIAVDAALTIVDLFPGDVDDLRLCCGGI